MTIIPDLIPKFKIRPVVELVPSVDTKQDSKTPKVQIHPVEELVPTILNK